MIPMRKIDLVNSQLRLIYWCLNGVNMLNKCGKNYGPGRYNNNMIKEFRAQKDSDDPKPHPEKTHPTVLSWEIPFAAE